MENTNERLRSALKKIGVNQTQFAEKLGISKQYVNALWNGKENLSKKLAIKINDAYGIDAAWLLFGGEENIPAIAPAGTGKPYYNVDFAASFSVMENDQTTHPDYFIDFKPYNGCDCWCNAYGNSMYPTIASGDIVAMKRVEDFRYLINGEIYGIVTSSGLRTIKRVQDNGDTLTLIADNKEVASQTIPKNIVKIVYRILGSIKQF